MLDPIGAIGAMLTGAVDIIGGLLGRKKKPSRGQRFWSTVLYLLFLAGGLAIIVLVVHELYFRK
jgi:Na+-driven multidrug efflux pump